MYSLNSLKDCIAYLHCCRLHMQNAGFLMSGFQQECVLDLSKQVRLKRACSLTKASWRQDMSDIETKYYTTLTANDSCNNQPKLVHS